MKILLILLFLSVFLGELVVLTAAQAAVEQRVREEEVANDGVSRGNHRNMQKSRYHSLTHSCIHSRT